MNIKDLIISQLDKQRQYNIDNYAGYFRASGSGSCLKKRYLLNQNVEASDEQSDASKITLMFGTAVHSELEQLVKEAVKQVDYLESLHEIRLVNHNFKLTGQFDMLLKNNETKTITIVDFKTAHSGKQKYVNERGVDYHYKLQIATYYKLLNSSDTKIVRFQDELVYEIPISSVPFLRDAHNYKWFGKVVYLYRDSALIDELEFAIDENLIKSVERELEQLKNIETIIKNIKYDYNNWQCKYCQFKTKCKNGEV